MTSLPWVLGRRRITAASLTNSFRRCPFKDYTINLNMILIIMCKSLILLKYVDSSMKNEFIHTLSYLLRQHHSNEVE